MAMADEEGVRGRPVAGAIGGLVLGLGAAADALFAGWLRLDSIWLVVIPVGLLVAGAVVGWLAPLRVLRR
jgi:hypothetical protein